MASKNREMTMTNPRPDLSQEVLQKANAGVLDHQVDLSLITQANSMQKATDFLSRSTYIYKFSEQVANSSTQPWPYATTEMDSELYAIRSWIALRNYKYRLVTSGLNMR
ncbi:hypothetical protein N7513_003606 [Penicillium frequentans]|nr:hypothetical protein N7513_003606 [Penicillium glabrum]